MNGFSKDSVLSGVSAGKIAGVIAAVAGGEAQNDEKVTLTIAQSIRDMVDSGQYGTGAERVLRYHFPRPLDEYAPCCLEAVRRVFVCKEKRRDDWKIYRVIRENEDAGECQKKLSKQISPCLKKYDFLGEDRKNEKEAFLYFGRKRSYCVEAGSYLVRSTARLMLRYLREKSVDGRIVEEDGRYKVRAGRFADRSAADDYLTLIKSFAVRNASVVSEL